VTLDSPDARHDHRVISAPLATIVVSPLPSLEDLKTPIRLRMGAFKDKREQWATLVNERVESLSGLQQLGALERLDEIKKIASSTARKVFGTTGGKLRKAIRYHSKESIRLMSLLRTVKAARRDIFSRKDADTSTGSSTLAAPSRAMREMWDRGLVPLRRPFAFLTDSFSPPHVGFTTEWQMLLRQTADQILVDFKKLRDDERKQAEAQFRSDAVRRMYQGGGELRRFLHSPDQQLYTPVVRSPVPDSLTLNVGA